MAWWRRKPVEDGLNPDMPLIRLEHVSKVFKGDAADEETRALSDVTVDIGRGEYISVSGPSGCGKSTFLSIGHQQLVAIACAIAGRPPILLADEPTGNLDSKSGDALMDMLGELHADGATVCLATHDPRYIARASRHIYLFDGSIVAEPVA